MRDASLSGQVIDHLTLCSLQFGHQSSQGLCSNLFQKPIRQLLVAATWSWPRPIGSLTAPSSAWTLASLGGGGRWPRDWPFFSSCQ